MGGLSTLTLKCPRPQQTAQGIHTEDTGWVEKFTLCPEVGDLFGENEPTENYFLIASCARSTLSAPGGQI